MNANDNNLVEEEKTVEAILRDVAFVLEMTRRVKKAILSEQPLPGENETRLRQRKQQIGKKPTMFAQHMADFGGPSC